MPLKGSDTIGKFSDNNSAQIIWDFQVLSLGTLAAGASTFVNSKIDNAREMGCKVLKTEWFISMTFPVVENGPFLFGIQHDMTANEQDDTLNADPQRRGDTTVSGQANHPMWALAILHPSHESQVEETGHLTQMGVHKVPWTYPEGTFMRWWVRNMRNVANDGGQNITIAAKHYTVWLRD